MCRSQGLSELISHQGQSFAVLFEASCSRLPSFIGQGQISAFGVLHKRAAPLPRWTETQIHRHTHMRGSGRAGPKELPQVTIQWCRWASSMNAPRAHSQISGWSCCPGHPAILPVEANTVSSSLSSLRAEQPV